MAAKTFFLLPGETSSFLFTTRDTVAVETSASLATSLIVLDLTQNTEDSLVIVSPPDESRGLYYQNFKTFTWQLPLLF
jgi:hypothetical protein